MKHVYTVALCAALAAASSLVLAAPSVDELWQTVQQQQAEIERLKKAQSATDDKVEATAEAVESGSGQAGKSLEWAAKTKIGGYGEHHYNNKNGADDSVDAHRFVLFVAHQYSDSIRFFSEFELEHGLAGPEEAPGEVELEQAYIAWDFAAKHSLIAGQFLIPVGIINETHEPDTFYGVERNGVEHRIIPATWWESGAMLQGELAPGLSYNLALHSGLNTDEANIRSGRQKSAKAKANDLAYTARIKYSGVPGLELAATVQRQEDISQGSLGNDVNVAATLFETHAVYSVDIFALRALYAQWDVDGDVAEQSGADEQSGWYLEPSVKPWHNLGFFARYSSRNTAAGDLGGDATEAWDYGVNYWLSDNVVFKADLQDIVDSDADSLNLGLGWSF